MSIVDWLTAIGEFAIAFVIVWELEESRHDRFFAEAAQFINYEDRGRIYAAFYETEGDAVEGKSRAFCKRIWKAAAENSSLKSSCERQILLFGRLAQIKRRAIFFRSDYVRLFPHAVVEFWIMVSPYIQERRAMTGEWWASDFEALTRECLKFLLKQKPETELKIYGTDRGRQQDFVIPNEYLVRLRSSFSPKVAASETAATS